MPLAARDATSTIAASNGGRIGDTRTHFMRIDTEGHDYQSFFTEDGSEVALDSNGKAVVTVDFVCLRCHNGKGNAFLLDFDAASMVAVGVHRTP